MKSTVIVDIDGTISKVGDRKKYIESEKKDWDKFYKACSEDEPVKEIINLVKVLSRSYKIIFCTGRKESVRDITEKWLNHYLGYSIVLKDRLLMRADDDRRHDKTVKPEMLKNARIDLNEIAFILEDRDSMVKKWRELGVICLQVAEGDF